MLAIIAGSFGRGIEAIPRLIVVSIVEEITPITESKMATINEL